VLSKTTVSLIDSPLQLIGDLTKKVNFLNFDHNEDQVKEDRQPHDLFFQTYLRISNKGKTTERRVYPILDMIGDVGGLNDALILIFSSIVSLINGSSHYLKAVVKVFAVNKNEYQAKFKPIPYETDAKRTLDELF
jgi:hypothetical protein